MAGLGGTDGLHGAFHFLLEVAGVTADQKTIHGGFKSMSGANSKTEIIEFKHGNDNVVRKKPGRTTFDNITLERGYTATDDLWRWRKNIEDGIIDRRAFSVHVMDNDLTTVVSQYNGFEGWPCTWTMPEMSSDSSAMAIEKIEIAHERLERVQK